MRPLKKPRLLLPIWTLHAQNARKAHGRVAAFRPSYRILSFILIVLGLVVAAASLSTFFLGAADTARIIERGYTWAAVQLGHADIQCYTAFYPAGSEGTHRALAPLWFLFGTALLSTGWDLDGRADLVPVLSSILFMGGAGRAMAYVDTGAPHPAFVVLMALELALPIVIMTFWSRI
ncbi:MAG: DUF4345 family protein [Pseudomonadota bacterium]